MSSPPYSQVVSWRIDCCGWNEISPPCIMRKQTSDPCPGLDIRFPSPHTFLAGLFVLPCRPGKPPAFRLGAGQSFCYSVFMTPTIAPQRPHFNMRSGFRPSAGAINCTLVSAGASTTRCPQTGHRMWRTFLFISWASPFFLGISHTLLSATAAVRHGSISTHYGFSYMTSSVSQVATGLAKRRAFRYAISRVRQVLPK